MLAKLTIEEFLTQTAAGTPVPGGGGVAALSAAAAASLVEMVANLTIGRKGFEAVDETLREIAESARSFRQRLLEDIDRDANAYTRVLEAFRLPRKTDEERQVRSGAIQEAFKGAAAVPLEVAIDALAVLELAATVVKIGNPNAATDGLVGAMLARSAVLSALCNVRVNLSSIRDESFVTDHRRQVELIEADVIRKEHLILSTMDL